MRAHGLLVSPVKRVEELLDDEQVAANGYLVTLEDGTTVPTMPFSLRGHEPGPGSGPAYGADTDAVLAELGFDEQAVLDLRVKGAVW